MEFELPTQCLAQLISFLFWTNFYIYCVENSNNRSPEWCTRLVTVLHGGVAAYLGLSLCGIHSISKCSLTARTGYIHYVLMLWSWGYFAFDLLWCLIYWSDHKLMLLHHGFTLAAITCYMNKSNTGCVYPCSIALMEITNPLLQMRWFLRDAGYDKTIIFYITEVTYLILFLGLRGVLGSYLIVKILASNLFALEDKLFALALYSVSAAFIYEILGFVLYKYHTKINEFEGFLVEMGIILDEHHA